MRKSVIMMLVLGLLGWVTRGQATAQVLSSDGLKRSFHRMEASRCSHFRTQ